MDVWIDRYRRKEGRRKEGRKKRRKERRYPNPKLASTYRENIDIVNTNCSKINSAHSLEISELSTMHK